MNRGDVQPGHRSLDFGLRLARVPVGKQIVKIAAEEKKTPARPGSSPKPSFFKTAWGVWEIDKGELVGTAKGFAILFGDSAWTDYDFSVEAKRTALNDGFGLFVRAPEKLVGAGEFVLGGFFNREHYVGTRGSKVARKEPGAIKTGEWYTALVRVRGNRIQCLLNGVKLFDMEHQFLPAGYVGLVSWQSPFRFRNIKVTAPDGKVLLEGLPELPSTYKNSLAIEFVLVPKGKSWLGGAGGKPGDKEIEFHEDFYLGKYQVTQEEWGKVMGKNPSHFSRSGGGKDAVKDISDADLKRFPVEMVSWDDCRMFIDRLNEKCKEGGWTYRLPTTKEWEYACRCGPLTDRSLSAFDFYLDKPRHDLVEQANFNDILHRTCKVGSYRPNRLGLFDMHGNVWQWCDDTEGLVDDRFAMGGSWAREADCSRAARRDTAIRSLRQNQVGLRLARVPVGKELVKIHEPPKDSPLEAKGHGLKFDGKNDHVELTLLRKENLPITVEAYVTPNAITKSAQVVRLVGPFLVGLAQVDDHWEAVVVAETPAKGKRAGVSVQNPAKELPSPPRAFTWRRFTMEKSFRFMSTASNIRVWPAPAASISDRRP
jgi:formylglycine-generating enzyme required for sulfatase activity